jgi:hypothetical protein
VLVADEKLKRFLDTLYALHIAAIKPGGAGTGGALEAAGPAVPSLLAGKPFANLHDFVADLVFGTWFAFDKRGTRMQARLNWISPLRATYIFTTRAGSELMVFTPEELAWEMSTGKATLVREPVPLFDRAVSATLEYLAGQKAKRSAGASEAAANRLLPALA